MKAFLHSAFLLLAGHALAQEPVSGRDTIANTAIHKMKIEIWSDVMCPFCYLGKRQLDSALAQFPGRDAVEIEWKSFQLNPDMKTDLSVSIHDYLVREKGIDAAQAQQMEARITDWGRRVGLEYHFERAVVANTFQAHRFLHVAKTRGRQHDAEERLFRAYFTEGKNVDDTPTLLALGRELGLPEQALAEALESGAYADAVRADLREAEALGIRGVPFFVFDRKYAVSGAQDSAVLLETMKRAFSEHGNK